MQPQGHAQLLINLIDFDLGLQEAVDVPRFRHTVERRVAIEAIGEDVLRGLSDRGHEVIDPTEVAFGGAQVIAKLAKGWAAASDPRKDGCAVGH